MTFLELISGVCQGMGFGLVAGWRTRQGRATPGEGKLLSGHAQQVAMGPGAAGESFTGQLGAGAGYGARAAAEAGGSAEAGGQGGLALGGDVPLGAADDLLLGRAFFGARVDVGAGGRVGAHPGDDDPVEGVVGLAVAAG